jgi:hypothetical protein
MLRKPSSTWTRAACLSGLALAAAGALGASDPPSHPTESALAPTFEPEGPTLPGSCTWPFSDDCNDEESCKRSVTSGCERQGHNGGVRNVQRQALVNGDAMCIGQCLNGAGVPVTYYVKICQRGGQGGDVPDLGLTGPQCPTMMLPLPLLPQLDAADPTFRREHQGPRAGNVRGGLR